MTFSIAAVDHATGEIGVAVESKYLAVGSIVPFARADVGVITTQFFANPRFGNLGLDLLEDGVTPEEVIERLLFADEHRVRRQLAVLSADGTVASYTGPACVSWAGDISGHGVICTGNTLVSEATLNSCLARYEAGSGDTLARRLVAGLEAAQAAGGDRNGQQSASLLVVSKDGGYGGYTDRLVDLRVDDHVTPIAELWRLLQVWKASRQ